MTDQTLPTDPARRMYATLALSGPVALRVAFATVRDTIDMGILPPEVVFDVVLGRRTLSQAMSDLADVLTDSLADDDDDATDGMEPIVADCSAAAAALKTH